MQGCGYKSRSLMPPQRDNATTGLRVTTKDEGVAEEANLANRAATLPAPHDGGEDRIHRGEGAIVGGRAKRGQKNRCQRRRVERCHCGALAVVDEGQQDCGFEGVEGSWSEGVQRGRWRARGVRAVDATVAAARDRGADINDACRRDTITPPTLPTWLLRSRLTCGRRKEGSQPERLQANGLHGGTIRGRATNEQIRARGPRPDPPARVNSGGERKRGGSAGVNGLNWHLAYRGSRRG